VTASKSGYQNSTNFFTPTSSTYIIALSTGNATVGFGSMFQDINYTLAPAVASVFNLSTNNSFAFAITSRNSTLNEYGINITNASGTQLFTSTVTADMDGGTITGSANCSYNKQYVNATIWFKSLNYSASPYVLTRQYWIYPVYATNGTNMTGLLGAGGSLASSGLSTTALALISLIISLVVTGGISKVAGIGGGGVIFVVVLSMFGVIGWLPPLIWMMVILLSGMLFLYRWS
jgi:hypothetical protein